MTQLPAVTLDDIGLKPEGNSWICCLDDEADAAFDASVTVSASDDGGWHILEIGTIRIAGSGNRRGVVYRALEGDTFKDVKAWIEAHRRRDIDDHVADTLRETVSGDYADYRRAVNG